MTLAAKVLNVAATKTIDEALDPMAAVLEETGPGQAAPRNMASWISRATATVLGGIYRVQDAASARSELQSAMMRDSVMQTEPPKTKDASAMIIDGQMESERLNNLEIAIPIPAELPVLTTSQLLELERRLGDLVSRLEDEILRADGEVRRRKEQAAEQAKREEVMSSNRFGKYTTNDEWALALRDRIEKRLHRRHGFEALPARQKKALDEVLNSPLKSKRLMRQQQEDQILLEMEKDDPFPVSSRSSQSASRAPASMNPPQLAHAARGGASLAAPASLGGFKAFGD